MTIQTIQFFDQTLRLHPYKAIFWQEEKTLLVADVHLGKAQHFRRRGIPVPQGVSDANWDRLISLLLDFQPRRLIFLGDLFHSEYNQEWEELKQLIQQFEHISFELVLGNHDILHESQYTSANLKVHPEPYELAPFLLSHHPMEAIPAECYNLAGHIHPCVYLSGQGRQRTRLACFYFGEEQGILPAFGTFTGMGTIRVKEGEKVYVIADDAVLEV